MDFNGEGRECAVADPVPTMTRTISPGQALETAGIGLIGRGIFEHTLRAVRSTDDYETVYEKTAATHALNVQGKGVVKAIVAN